MLKRVCVHQVFLLFLLLLLLSRCGECNRSEKSASENVRCASADLHALLSFKAHIVEDKSEIFKSWNGSSCCAGWEGVECDPSTSRVVKLELQSHSKENDSAYMRGFLSPALGNLAYLQTLVINGFREIKGPIPASICNLRRLRQLYLENNKLSGPIPKEVGSLSMLETLSLNGNRLNGSIPQSIARLENLIQLNLAKNRLSGALSVSFQSLRSLQFLDLNDNRLSGRVPALPSGLTFIDLSNNAFTGTIPESLANLSSLATLSLARNSLTGPIPAALGRLPALSTLALNENLLGGPIPTSLANVSTLWSVNLSRNFLVDPVPRELANASGLLSLDLSYNHLKLRRIPAWINSKSMTDVHLAGCGIKGRLEDWTPKTTSMLTSIDFTDNELTGSIGKTFSNMSRLEKIHLGNNKLSSNLSEAVFPELIGTVDLHGNRLFGTIKNILYDFSGACSNAGGCLEFLDLSDNLISGSFPALDAERKIKYIDLSGNNLTGSLPQSISMLKSLNFLDLSRNKLSGSVPASLGTLSELQWLDLSRNALTGSLPKEMENLKKLSHVNFRNNRLCGAIPQCQPLSVFPAAAFLHNECLCGYPLPACK